MGTKYLLRGRTRCLGPRGRHRPHRLRRTRRLRSRRRPRCVSPTQTPSGRLLRWWTRRPCWKISLASSREPWGRVWSWFSSLVRPRLGPTGASADGAVAWDAAESRQPDDQTQADKDQLGLITETHSPEVRTVVRVLLCGIIVCLRFALLCCVPFYTKITLVLLLYVLI